MKLFQTPANCAYFFGSYLPIWLIFIHILILIYPVSILINISNHSHFPFGDVTIIESFGAVLCPWAAWKSRHLSGRPDPPGKFFFSFFKLELPFTFVWCQMLYRVWPVCLDTHDVALAYQLSGLLVFRWLWIQNFWNAWAGIRGNDFGINLIIAKGFLK